MAYLFVCLPSTKHLSGTGSHLCLVAWRRGDEGKQASQPAFSLPASCGGDSVAGHCLLPVLSPLHTKRNRRILIDLQEKAQREVTLNVPRCSSHTHWVRFFIHCFVLNLVSSTHSFSSGPHPVLRILVRLTNTSLYHFSLLPVLEILLNTAASTLPAPLPHPSPQADNPIARHSKAGSAPCRL